jgi:16S rRNA processing protein RimM
MSTGDAPAETVGAVTVDGSPGARPTGPATGPCGTVEVVVGRVARAHGLRGDVLVEVRTDEPERRFAVGARFRTPRGDLDVASVAWHGTRLLTRFEGVSGRDAADGLRGLELRVELPAGERPDDPEEYYDHQLIGLGVFDPEGVRVGEVADVLHLPAQDLLSVRRDAGGDSGAEVLVPFVRALVPTVDLAAQRADLARTLESLLADDEPGASDAPVTDEPSRY